jgi:hypothetical protein
MRSLLAIIILLAAHSARGADAPPNILLILSDDQSVPHLGCYDNPDIKTPHIFSFASTTRIAHSTRTPSPIPTTRRSSSCRRSIRTPSWCARISPGITTRSPVLTGTSALSWLS